MNRDGTIDVRPLIEARKREAERKRRDEPRVELYRRLTRHLTAIVYLLAELDLGYKPDLKDQ